MSLFSGQMKIELFCYSHIKQFTKNLNWFCLFGDHHFWMTKHGLIYTLNRPSAVYTSFVIGLNILEWHLSLFVRMYILQNGRSLTCYTSGLLAETSGGEFELQISPGFSVY